MQNLSMTVTGKFTEWLHIYLVFSKIAREEGLEQMAVMFEHVSEIEKNYEKQFVEAIIKQIKCTMCKGEKGASWQILIFI